MESPLKTPIRPRRRNFSSRPWSSVRGQKVALMRAPTSSDMGRPRWTRGRGRKPPSGRRRR